MGTGAGPGAGSGGGEPERFAARDEPFWQAQEARLAEQLGQPCCTLSGMCTLLGNQRGGLAVIVHGERDCANSFVYHRMAAAHRFFVTGVTEEEATTGRVDEPLETCLRLVLAEPGVEAVLVLGTCLMSMIGADPQATVDRVVRDTGTALPVRFLSTGGLRLGSQSEMADWLYATLAELPGEVGGAPGGVQIDLGIVAAPEASPQEANASATASASVSTSVSRSASPVTSRSASTVTSGSTSPQAPSEPTLSLLGLPPEQVLDSELPRALSAAGVRLVGLYPDAPDLAAWRRLSRTDLIAVADERLYPRLLEVARVRHGIATVEVPLPVGLGQSMTFYQRIGERLGVARALEAAVARERARAEQALARFRRRAVGLRLALGIRMLNNYRADQLAYDGLGDAEAFAEVGLETTLLIQGPPEGAPRFAAMLERLGCALPFRVFPSPWNLAPLLAEGRYDVAYLADHAREEARKVGLPMIESRTMAPFLRGVGRNLARLEALLQAAREEGSR